MVSLLDPLPREVIATAAIVLPERRRIAVERWLRGRAEARRLARADAVIVSFGNSGRTWLRVLLSRFYQIRNGLRQFRVIAFDNLHQEHAAIPRLLFTHDNYLPDYAGSADRAEIYRDRKVVLLVRDPADVAVSQYHQWRHRMGAEKRRLNAYPIEGDPGLAAFVADPRWGVPKIIRFLNAWAAARPALSRLHLVRYEDLRAAPERHLGELLAALGTPGSEEEIADAVAFASLDNMRRLEDSAEGLLESSRRTAPDDPAHASAYKARRGRVGGYRDELPAETVAVVDALIEHELSPLFGYGRSRQVGTPGQGGLG